MNIGLHAAMLERRYTLPEALVQAAVLGADSYEIDLGIGRPGEPWDDRAARFKQLIPMLRETAARRGLELATLCLGTLWQTSLASAEPAERAQAVRVVKDVCAFASQLGVTVLLLPVGQPASLELQRARAILTASLRECLPVAEVYGVTLALENVCQPFLLGADDLLEVIEPLNKRCRIYYDLGNPSFIGHDPEAELLALAPYLARVHAKDTIAVRRERPPLPETPITGDFFVWQARTTVTLGHGGVPLASLADHLHRLGYSSGIIIEVPQTPANAERGCRENLAAARRLFARA